MKHRLVTMCAAAICACFPLHEPRGATCAHPTQARTNRDSSPTAAGPLETHHEITVLLFVATDCPISNRYAPVMRQLAEGVPADRVAFWLVYADPATNEEAARRHREAFELPITAVLDHSHRLVRLAGATTVPEAVVFAGRGDKRRMAYRGRIDDRFPALGVIRAEPARHDLKCVLDSLLSGQVTEFPSQAAVGCPIPNLVQFK
jgi:hypothetical protein